MLSVQEVQNPIMTSTSEEPASLDKIRKRLEEFAQDRDWSQFHSPKNLVMALVGEVGELVEEFQWLTEDESRRISGDRLRRVQEELADVQTYLIMIAEKLGIDLLSAVDQKINQNEAKYPVDKAKGTSKKYTEL
jgi:NTP pyrophosphatase (non-canonical NTP hydrolase)